jgi:hypothetical protein
MDSNEYGKGMARPLNWSGMKLTVRRGENQHRAASPVYQYELCDDCTTQLLDFLK